MFRFPAILLLILLAVPGCTFQPNGASQGVTFDPFQWRAGQVFSPANDNNYVNGEPLDMRRK